MLNLLRADLYRITRIRRLRGVFWQYLILLAVFILLDNAAWWISRLFDPPANTIPITIEYETTSVFALRLLGFGMPALVIACSFGALEILFHDLSNGFLKNTVSSARGRLAVFAEKILLVGIWSLMMMLTGIVIVILEQIAIVLTINTSSVVFTEPPLQFALWALGTWLVVWALALIPFFFALALRRKIPSYIFAGIVAAPSIPTYLLALASTPGILLFLNPIKPFLSDLAIWSPGTAISILSMGRSALEGTVVGAMVSARSPLGLSSAYVNLLVLAIMIGMLWIVIASALFLLVARKKDL